MDTCLLLGGCLGIFNALNWALPRNFPRDWKRPEVSQKSADCAESMGEIKYFLFPETPDSAKKSLKERGKSSTGSIFQFPGLASYHLQLELQAAVFVSLEQDSASSCITKNRLHHCHRNVMHVHVQMPFCEWKLLPLSTWGVMITLNHQTIFVTKHYLEKKIAQGPSQNVSRNYLTVSDANLLWLSLNPKRHSSDIRMYLSREKANPCLVRPPGKLERVNAMRI